MGVCQGRQQEKKEVPWAWKSMNWKRQRIIQCRGCKTLNKSGSHFSLLDIILKMKHYKHTSKQHINYTHVQDLSLGVPVPREEEQTLDDHIMRARKIFLFPTTQRTLNRSSHESSGPRDLGIQYCLLAKVLTQITSLGNLPVVSYLMQTSFRTFKKKKKVCLAENIID